MAVYILHLDRKLSHAAHYTGFAQRVQERLDHHAKGTGARMMQVCKERGIGFQLARVFDQADKAFERKLKKTKNVARYCPLCRGEAARNYSPKSVEAQ